MKPTRQRPLINEFAWSVSVLVFAFAVAPVAADACDVPVFRYALERWTSDSYRATVFYRGELTDDDAEAVANLRKQSHREQGTANLDVHICDVDRPLEPEFAQLLNKPQEALLPRLVLQSPVINGRRFVVCSSEVRDFDAELAFNSPAGSRVVERLFAGDSVVWLVFTAAGEEFATKVEMLTHELDRLGDELPLPEGIGLPGSEVYSDVPLTLRFSVVTAGMGDPAERFLETSLRQFAPPSAARQPIVVPVYGRGRALAVLPLAEIDVASIEDLSRFLSGPCSCQVKEQNPGFDLPLAVDWEARLFGDFVPPPTGNGAAPAGAGPEATLVAIPPGATTSHASQAASTTPTANREERVNPLGVILFAMTACAVLWTIGTRRAALGGRGSASDRSDKLT